VAASFGLDQLSAGADAIVHHANAAIEHIAHPQLVADLFHVDSWSLVGEARIAGNDEQPSDARQPGDDVLGDTVGEVFLTRIAAQIFETATQQSRACQAAPVWRALALTPRSIRPLPISDHLPVL
jgi:hypothetical protein